MDIKTQHSIGDKFFYMKNNAINEGKVEEIEVNVRLQDDKLVTHTTYWYRRYSSNVSAGVDDDSFYSTRQALIKTL